MDLGPNAPIEEVARRIHDLSVLVEVGHGWGVELARTAADWDLSYELRTGGPDAVERLLEAEEMPFPARWLPSGSPFLEPVWPRADLEWLALRDLHAESLLGTPTSVQRLEYANPIELILLGSGLLLRGVIIAARLVRDWSAQRRINSATAREAEAQARMTEDRARLYSWMVDQATSGQSPIPVGDLVQITTPADIRALSRLAEDPVTLELPRGSE